MSVARHRISSLVACIGSAWLASCSLLVDPGSLEIKCQPALGVNDVDPCNEPGLHCVAGTCQSCAGARELCNGVDDDCDGKIDEGYDPDGDHYTWCGGGVSELADCAPNDPTIHPSPTNTLDGIANAAAIELCDGKDNDCDGKVDESPECMQTQSCTQTGCRLQGQYCDAQSGRCITPRPVGSGCSNDAECEGGFCVNPSMFHVNGDAQAKRCARACCTDSDCASGTVCEVGSSGVRACLPTDIVTRGDARAGALCSDASDCASGVCVLKTCRARCKSEADCSGESCVLSPSSLNGPQTWLCGAAAGRGSTGDLCTVFDPTACKSALCQGTNCAGACGRTSDCPSDEGCGLVEIASLVPLSTSALAICAKSKDATDSLCCTTQDCASGQLCKPRALGMHFGMACQAP